MSTRHFITVLAIGAGLIISSCSSSDDDSSGAVAAEETAVTESEADQSSVTPVAADDAEEQFREYEETDRLPVANETEIVGYMSYSEYYAGEQDPVVIEVRSYDDDSLIGYRLRFVGFVPLADLAGEGSIEDRVEALYGDRQAEAQAALDLQNEQLNSMTEEELREFEAQSADE